MVCSTSRQQLIFLELDVVPFLIPQVKEHTLIRDYLDPFETPKHQESIAPMLIVNHNAGMTSTIDPIVFLPLPVA